MRQVPVKRDQAAPSRIQVPRWFALASGFVGTVFGIATNLYSDEFRKAIASSGRIVGPTILSVLIAAAVASTVTAVMYRWLVRRRQERAQILPGDISIGTDVLAAVGDERDLVVGRSLHFIEAKRDSAELVVFLHGLGLDANDFRPYMAESRFHCLALTLYGFNDQEKDDDHFRPISLQTHVQLLAYALKRIKQMHPQKKLSVVGFSFGADVMLLLPEYTPDLVRGLAVDKMVLLDPNINRTTTTISSRIAKVDPARPLGELIKILESAGNVAEFRNLCEYLYKITAKNFGQIQRHAREMIALWDTAAYDYFLDRLGRLKSVAEACHVVLSFDYDEHFNAIARGAQVRGLSPDDLECSRSGHFELISAHFLKERLEGLL